MSCANLIRDKIPLSFTTLHAFAMAMTFCLIYHMQEGLRVPSCRYRAVKGLPSAPKSLCHCSFKAVPKAHAVIPSGQVSDPFPGVHLSSSFRSFVMMNQATGGSKGPLGLAPEQRPRPKRQCFTVRVSSASRPSRRGLNFEHRKTIVFILPC